MESLFKRHLRSAGLKLTPPRTAVFANLSQSGPMTMSELVERSNNDRASIYRAVKLFGDLGILQHLIVGGRKVVELTDIFSRHHHHLSCSGCGKLQSVDDEQLESALDQLVAAHGFAAHSHMIEVSGLCSDCASKH